MNNQIYHISAIEQLEFYILFHYLRHSYTKVIILTLEMYFLLKPFVTLPGYINQTVELYLCYSLESAS